MEVADTNGCIYGTIQTGDCELLCAVESPLPRRCKSCSRYRSNLRVARWMNQRKDVRGCIAHDSHCNIRYLSEQGRLQWLESFHKQKAVLREKMK